MDNITLTLYNNTSAPNVVKKRYSTLQTLTGQLKENVNMQNVVITIPYFANYASCNYAYIPQFHRYYYVSIEVMDGERLKLTMKSDPLTSFWDNYCNSPCIARRSSSAPNPNIKDDLIPFKPQPVIIRRRSTQHFTPSSNGGCYILTIGGK